MCMPYHHYYQRYGRDRDLNLQVTHEIRARIKQDRETGRSAMCENCEAVEGTHECRGYHGINGETSMILCAACNNFYSKNKRHRPENDQHILKTRAWMKHDREVGIPIFCVHCNAQETADLIATTFQFVVGT
ncbi:uncharacterized protein ASPGLDRAFT_829603 [Aspergillus glaucus CBS 516.65]|uniref:Uncharacterized protein n=1 Tax=Aspergillus glaucus CBS 516.65 TaxID=1160497 RepID=A0A1L9V9Z3_ASPGL|nr:hypothetical protein ASPGLDRAFT_829603 [Aspergillus glaucus CBS 516.65]OJJ80747.1 hypothetical protein ASPGLDRAFT_829603 [Aspergillus glaucus CBS 516.65]